MRVWSLWRIPNLKTKGEEPKPKFSRTLDLPRFESILASKTLKGEIDEVDEVNQMLVQSFHISDQTRRHKKWFNQECVRMKRQLLKAHDNISYSRIQRTYKTLLRDARVKYEEKKLFEKIQASNTAPWVMLNKAREFVNRIGSSTWFKHFKTLFEVPMTDVNVTTASLQDDAWYNQPFILKEIEDAVMSLKQKKAPECDNIANEDVQQSFGCLAE